MIEAIFPNTPYAINETLEMTKTRTDITKHLPILLYMNCMYKQIRIWKGDSHDFEGVSRLVLSILFVALDYNKSFLE